MTQAVVTPGRVGAYEALTLENRYLRAVVIPELRSRVWELEDRIRGRQWIWHREGVPLAASAPGAVDREFVYVSELPALWCAVDDSERQAAIRMSFEARTLPFVWLFLSYGGWRDAYTAVLEPCTNLPKDLAEAARLGQSARLDPTGEFTTTVTIGLGPLLEAAR